MSVLLSLEKIYLTFGSEPLLDQVNFQVHSGERVCLIGRNGAGKSSLLKLVDGSIEADSGKIYREPGVNISRLEQELPEETNVTVYEFISQAFNHFPVEEWQAEKWIQEILARLSLIGTRQISDLSGGWKRRVALAKALVTQPDLLLLDEPTNHLDIEAIQWLEDQLLKFKGGILFITHDRWLLRRLATRIIELDRGLLTSWPGDYDNFLRRKEEMLSAEAHQNKIFDKKLAKEEEWIRQGIKARRTRNEGRVRELKMLRKERQQRRESLGKAKLEVNQADQSGHLVIEAQHVSHQYDGKPIINDFSMRIMRGDRIGLLGPNGIGKTTLLNTLLGEIQPDKGKIKLGTKLDIAYFDQSRAKLDLEQSIMENVAGGRTSITVNGKEKHIVSYLADFLFPADRIHTSVKALSGGECNRLLLAQLFSKPANMLVMDEPTNDLDIETLELLEELLSQFSGTLLLVSHDRSFMDNVVTRTLAFEGEGKITEYIGGYQDWLDQVPMRNPQVKEKAVEPLVKPAKKLSNSYQDRKELSSLMAKVEKMEKKKQQFLTEMGEPSFYEQTPEKVSQATEALQKLEEEIDHAYEQWTILEDRLSD